MASKIVTTSLLIFMLAAAALTAETPRGKEGLDGFPNPSPKTIEAPADGTTLPMDDFGGRPVVALEINGKGPYRFILDTGATGTVLETALSKELALPVSSEGHGGFGGPGFSIVSIAAIRVGPIVLREVAAVVGPVISMGGQGSPRGVLSASSFPGYLVTFDYPGKRISIRKGKLPNPDSRSVFQYASGELLPIVPLRVAGRTIPARVDSGSGSSLILPTRFLKELPLGSEPSPAGTVRTHAGDAPMSRASVRGPIELGRYALALPDVVFCDVTPGGDAPIGNIGYQVLRDFVVTFDSKNRRIRLERSV